MKLADRLRSALGIESSMEEFREFTFDNLDETDTIVVTTNLNIPLQTVDDPETIGAVLGFVRGHSGGWTVPDMGVPIARLRLNFYAGDRPLGNVGVGHGFLTALQFGSFWYKATDDAQRARLLDIIGLEDPAAGQG
jgi:hypothetical protein